MIRSVPDPVVVRRQNELFDLYAAWPGEGDPDDDPEFVDAARRIMGLPPLGPESIRAALLDDEPDDPDLDEIEAWAAEDETVEDVERAAGHDVTPGHDELHHYWTRGEGLAKWVGSPTPWRTLYALVTKAVRKSGRVVAPEQIRRWVSRWFIEVNHYAAGSDENRVAHGHPPRGHRVGPG